MKIKFTLFQVLLIIIILLTLYYLGPLFYNAWINPEYTKSGSLHHKTVFVRATGSVIIGVPIIIYLILTDFKILYKKREINLTPWKSTN